MSENEPQEWFLNEYTCYRCGFEWQHEDDCCPDDDCPECEASHISPHTSTSASSPESDPQPVVVQIEYADQDEGLC